LLLAEDTMAKEDYAIAVMVRENKPAPSAHSIGK